MQRMKLLLTSLLMLGLASCGNVYHYGLNQKLAEILQTDPYYIKDGYEFHSILFVSDDKNLVIKLQHPLHPIPEPQNFKSFVQISLKNPKNNTLKINSISLKHIDAEGRLITPVSSTYKVFESREYIPSYNVYQTNTYEKAQLSPKLQEAVEVDFTYNGKHHTLSFNKRIHKVKRWSNVDVYLSM